MPFKKGQSGNPGGRPKAKLEDGRTLADLAREHTVEAVDTLLEVMRDRQAGATARTAAAGTILDRGWGKPPQALEHSGPDGGPISIDLTGLTDEQLAAIEGIGGAED